MQQMTKRIINACNLDAGAVDEYGTDEVTDPVQEFLGADYKCKMAVLKAAIKPLLTALDQTRMQLAVDHRCEYWLTAIPCGDLPEGMDTGKLLDATISLGDAQHLVAVID